MSQCVYPHVIPVSFSFLKRSQLLEVFAVLVPRAYTFFRWVWPLWNFSDCTSNLKSMESKKGLFSQNKQMIAFPYMSDIK